MVDFRPLHGLRYNAPVAGDIGDVLAPPYDVISDEAQRALYQRSPYNVVRLEYGVESPGEDANRYQAAAAILAGWQRSGVLEADPHPSFYLYEQQFEHAGRAYRRRSIIGRVRLEPWHNGDILPHEHTLSGPKQDRLRLLRACRTNVSPVFSLYRPDGGEAIAICERALPAKPQIDAQDSAGQAHRLWVIDDSLAVQQLQYHFASQRLYVADGHHRYETALAYRDERMAAETQWSDDEAENFVLMALTAADDPGLLILPIHRLVRPVRTPARLTSALEETFTLSDAAGNLDEAAVSALLQHLQRPDGAKPAFAALGVDGGGLVATPRNREAIEALMPTGHSEAWRTLAVNLLQYGVLEPLLGIDIETVRTGDHVSFTESATEARHAVASGVFPLAFLLNATRPEEIFAVADAGDRMPQKSTFFYPKLGTGLVLYSLDLHAVAGASTL